MTDPRHPDVEEANLRLTEGLKACRSIVSNYRSMIAGDDAGSEEADPDSSELDL